MKVRELAQLARQVAERWARQKGYCTTLLLQCAVASSAFVAAAAEVGIEAELVCGYIVADPAFDPEPHFYVLAWEDGSCLLVDLTATQYFPDAPPAAVLAADDVGTGLYLFQSAGAEARGHMHRQDVEEAREVLDLLLPELPREFLHGRGAAGVMGGRRDRP